MPDQGRPRPAAKLTKLSSVTATWSLLAATDRCMAAPEVCVQGRRIAAATQPDSVASRRLMRASGGSTGPSVAGPTGPSAGPTGPSDGPPSVLVTGPPSGPPIPPGIPSPRSRLRFEQAADVRSSGQRIKDARLERCSIAAPLSAPGPPGTGQTNQVTQIRSAGRRRRTNPRAPGPA